MNRGWSKWPGTRSQSYYLSLFTAVGWRIMSTGHKIKTLLRNTTWRSSADFMLLCNGICVQLKIAASSWQRIRAFSASDSYFLHHTQHSRGSSSSIFSWVLCLFRKLKKKWWKVPDFRNEGTFCRMRRSNYSRFTIRSSCNASNNGWNGWRSVCCPSESTLKVWVSDLQRWVI